MPRIQPQHLILALDLDNPQEALDWARRLGPRIGCYKVGLQLFSNGGPDVVRRLHDSGVDVFLDLKLHDIPNTVSKATAALAGLGVKFLTIHTLGGRDMMRAAAEASGGRTTLLGVTILTSLSDTDVGELGFDHSASGEAMHLARLALNSGLSGLVCSPLEVPLIRRQMGDGPVLVTPGVRPEGSGHDDQSRTATPADALRDGASHLVVGRPILAATDPVAVVDSLLATDY